MLPVPLNDSIVYPWWAKRIAFGNIIFFEILFIVWVAVFGYRYIERNIFNGAGIIRTSARLIVALAVWCGTVSVMSPLPLLDAGRSFRLLLVASLLLATVRWAKQMGAYTLTVLVLGIFAGTTVNLLMTFQYPNIVHGLFRLSGQNTPGVVAAVNIHLAAWLFFSSSRRTLQITCIIITLVCCFASSISFSRVGWIVSSLGLVAWAYVLFFPKKTENLQRRDFRNSPRTWIIMTVATLLGSTLMFSSELDMLISWIGALLMEKKWFSGQSNDFRIAYFIGTAEIVFRYPLGVGYSGFLEAMQDTKIYQSGIAARESGYDANPHSSILYYISAGGIPAAFIVIALFISLLNALRLGLEGVFKEGGRLFFALIALSYFVIGLTVPYIFNSIILVIPVGIAVGLRRQLFVDVE